jgi:hypothetical protein
MANLRPATTGLPMVVWISERGLARHDVRVKVNTVHGLRVQYANMGTVAGHPAPRLVAGQLSAADLQAVSDSIRLSEAALVAYWDRHSRPRRTHGCNRAGPLHARSDPGAVRANQRLAQRFIGSRPRFLRSFTLLNSACSVSGPLVAA